MAPSPIEVAKKTIAGEGVKMNIGRVAKIAKTVAKKNGYGFAEVSQRAKSDVAEFEFMLAHKFDYFARDEITVEIECEELKSLKNGEDQGDVSIKIVGKVFIDYRNDWGKSPMMQFLFKVYQTYFGRAKMGRLYMGPCAKMVGLLYEEYKKELDLPS